MVDISSSVNDETSIPSKTVSKGNKPYVPLMLEKAKSTQSRSKGFDPRSKELQ